MDENRGYLQKAGEYVSFIQKTVTPSGRANLGRCFGMPASKAAIEPLIDFFRVANFQTNGWSPYLESRFFVTCLACAFGASGKGRRAPEEILRSLYWNENTSESTKAAISEILATNLDERAIILTKLARVFNIAGKEAVKNIDLAKLLYDIENWNWPNILDGPRGRWANAILSYRSVNYPPLNR